ncbi:MAG: Crp/Fnr family transcriptional regulator [Rickettsiales bacterium]
MKFAAKKRFTTSRDETYHLLRDSNLFSSLPNDEITNIAKDISPPTSFEQGQIIYLENESAQYCYIICQGWVKLFHETSDGIEAIIDVYSSGQTFGESAIFYNNRYSHSAQIVQDSKLLIIPLSILAEHLKNSSFAINMLSLMSRQTKRKDLELAHLSVQTAAQRIGCFLLRLCPKDKQTNITLQLPYDKALLASRLGMKTETFSRALNTLRKETGISITGPRVTINSTAKLVNFTCCACSLIYPCQASST